MNAQTDYSELIALLETHKEDVIFLTRDGAPVVEMRLSAPQTAKRRLGIGNGKFQLPDNFWELDQEMDREMEKMFEETPEKPDETV